MEDVQNLLLLTFFSKDFEFKQYKIIYWNKLNEEEKLKFLQNAKIVVNNFKRCFFKNNFEENIRYICMLDDNMGLELLLVSLLNFIQVVF